MRTLRYRAALIDEEGEHNVGPWYDTFAEAEEGLSLFINMEGKPFVEQQSVEYGEIKKAKQPMYRAAAVERGSGSVHYGPWKSYEDEAREWKRFFRAVHDGNGYLYQRIVIEEN